MDGMPIDPEQAKAAWAAQLAAQYPATRDVTDPAYPEPTSLSAALLGWKPSQEEMQRKYVAPGTLSAFYPQVQGSRSGAWAHDYSVQNPAVPAWRVALKGMF